MKKDNLNVDKKPLSRGISNVEERVFESEFEIFYNNFISNENDIDFSKNGITSLKGAPNKIKDHFDFSKNGITSLKGAPNKI